MSTKIILFIGCILFINVISAFAATTTSPAECNILLAIIDIKPKTVPLNANETLVPADLVTGPILQDVDYSDLVGLRVVGRIQHNSYQPNESREFINGTIKAVRVTLDEFNLPQLEAVIQSATKPQIIHFSDYSKRDYYAELYIIQPLSAKQVPAIFPRRLLRQLFQVNFKHELSAEDVAAAHLLVQTYLSLPASYGANGTVNTLLGKSPKTTKHFNYGKLADNKNYSKKGLVQTMLWLRIWMEWNHIITMTEQSEAKMPSWLRLKTVEIEVKATAFLRWLEQI